MVVPSACSHAEPDHIPDISSHATTDSTPLTEVAAASVKRFRRIIARGSTDTGADARFTPSSGEAVLWNAARVCRRVSRRVCRRRVRRPCNQRACRPSSVLCCMPTAGQRGDVVRHAGGWLGRVRSARGQRELLLHWRLA
jgi:hypothetical protein